MNRFVRLEYVRDEDAPPEEQPDPRTVFLRDASKSAISYNDSPDVGPGAYLNPYRGCEHGCAYCYARPYHEYLGFSAGLDFETKILVKEDLPKLLRNELSSPRYVPQPLGLSGITDCYQPAERRFQVTRRCLEVLAEFRHPVGIVTKNALVARDADLLARLASHKAALVMISITTLDGELARKLEPRASHPLARLRTVQALAEAGIPVGVMVAPIIPGLNDHEIPAILSAAHAAGARSAAYTVVRLPYAVKDVFKAWVERHFPGRAGKVLSQIRAMRGGALNRSAFGSRMRGEGPFAEHIKAVFRLGKKRAGFLGGFPELSTASFIRPAGPQLELF